MRSAAALLLLLAVFAPILRAQNADDLVLVDCRLPPKMKRIGGRTYPVAARPIRTTALDCRIRGGEYTVYDRANYATSLKIWLDAAEKGDRDAQYYVGKLYEGGLGTPPDFAAAARWYAKAADAGLSAAQFSLGTLYEKGLGVPADPAKAFALYRRASGLPDNVVLVESAKYEELERAANDLAAREQEIDELQRQLDDARKQHKLDHQRERELTQQLDAAKQKADTQRKDVASKRNAVHVAATNAAPLPSAKRGTLGRYVALVIGNATYDHLPPMPSAETNARAVAALLRDAYGFDVTLLLNARNDAILASLYKLSQTLGENDNLVVYYAGHGRRDLRNRRGWWLPADADADAAAKTNWLPNQDVSDRLALVPARHILVLADASYVGDITRGAPQPAPSNLTAAQWSKYLETTKSRRARLALSSGADEPSATGSRFTAALLEVLQKQKGVVPASRIHQEVVNVLTADERVTSAVPIFAPLQSAFHDGVDFLFERR
ncbi:MAG: SEL1-like repeat protein [Acidobacteria bacterium]|nr:SEL1-like repeat protein [Acidobacteriota bacterium]MBV9479110.1 SEL1-like repeat protein [Acidobacteriota bacterium]